VLTYVPDDGYSEPFYIEGVPRLYGAIRGRRRPIHGRLLSRLREKIRRLSEEAADEEACKLCAEHLESWDQVDRSGKPIEVSPRAVVDLQPVLRFRFLQILQGFEATDVDPEWTPEERRAAEGLKADAELAGVAPGDLASERDRGN
jgi:hypothetical protein